MCLTFFFFFLFFFFNDTATTEIYTLSLHDALPISGLAGIIFQIAKSQRKDAKAQSRKGFLSFLSTQHSALSTDRKSTRLNSSHSSISYAVFCLKKKKKKKTK